MEEKNSIIQKNIVGIKKKDRILKLVNVLLTIAVLVIVALILLHRLYFKENMYSLLNNEVVNSTQIVELTDKGKEDDGEKILYYIIFSNEDMKNKIYVDEHIYNEWELGEETVVKVKDIFDKKGQILKEELLFDIAD